MSSATPYEDAFARLRDVFALYRSSPSVLVNSLELQEYTLDASRAARAIGVPFAALCAEFGRAATESLCDDRLTALRVGRAMVQWAGAVYQRPAAAAS
jgi:hypothetical protein